MDNINDYIVDEDSRFVMNKEDVQFLDDNGEVIVGDIKEYMRKKRESMLTITDKLNVGDVVKLKGSGQIVVVQFVDYKFNEIVKADYAGTLFNTDYENLILFGQEDIEKIYDRSLVEEAQKKTR